MTTYKIRPLEWVESKTHLGRSTFRAQVGQYFCDVVANGGDDSCSYEVSQGGYSYVRGTERRIAEGKSRAEQYVREAIEQYLIEVEEEE